MTITQHYVVELFDAVDALDATAFAARFTEDGTFRFGNSPAVAGRQQIEESVAGFFSTIGGLKHAIVGVWSGAWEGGAVASVETTVAYRRKDATVTDAIPATSTLRMRGDLIADFRVFADISPVFARAGGSGDGEAAATASGRPG
jgi:ketosteroid isomerase-like protein